MSNNLGLSQIAATQSNKHVTANDQVGQLDAALTEVLSVEIDDTNAATVLTEDFQRHAFFDVVDASTPPDDAITVTVPAIKRGLFVVRNEAAQLVTVEITGQPATRLENFKDIWWIESHSTKFGMKQRGPGSSMFPDDDWAGKHVAGHGALGDKAMEYRENNPPVVGFEGFEGTDSFTFLHLLEGDPDNPDSPHWGGQFEKGDPSGHPNFYTDKGNGEQTIIRERDEYLTDLMQRLDWLR